MNIVSSKGVHALTIYLRKPQYFYTSLKAKKSLLNCKIKRITWLRSNCVANAGFTVCMSNTGLTVWLTQASLCG